MTCVLVVDDDEQMCRLAERILGQAGFAVVTAGSAVDARLVLERMAVDVVISDEVMPATRGVDLLREVRTSHPAIATALLTGHATLETALRAINEAAVDHMSTKPYTADSLVQTVAAALEAARARRALVDARPSDLADALPGSVSAREIEVLALLLDGKRVGQIARALFISNHTVRNHLKALYRKTGARSQVELIERFGARPKRS
jgi:DNA-binding NarL/FixJ family response regulator